MESMNIFAKRLKELREENGLIQKELADKIGVKRGTVAAWEAGRMPERGALERIANYFDISVDYLLGRSDVRSEVTHRETQDVTVEELEKVLKDANIMFDGYSLDNEDKEDVIEFVKVALRAIKKRKLERGETTQ